MSCDNCDCAKCKASRMRAPQNVHPGDKPVECGLCHGQGHYWVNDGRGGYSENCPHCWVRIR